MEEDKILEEVYGIKTAGDLDEADIAWAKQAFKEPEDFNRLRRLLRIMNEDERGIVYNTSEDIALAEEKELARFAIEVKINHLASEKIRQALVAFYVLLRDTKVKEKKESDRKAMQEEMEELKRTKEFNKNKPKRFGDNL